MGQRKLLPILLTSAFIMALAGSFFAGYGTFVDDPFHDLTDEADEDMGGDRDDPSGLPLNTSPEGNSGQTDGGIPGWVLPLMGASAVIAVLFLVGSGDLYLRSKRGENLVRADLLDLITVNPGINLTSIRKELQLSQGAVSYHIMKLEKMGKIFSEKGSKERRYYPSSMGYQAAMRQAHMDEIESILSNETSRSIVDLLRDGPCSQNDLVSQLDISPSTVHWHMERMKRVGLISKESRGRSVFYELNELPPRNT
ncbi:MAG: winged helix-turn-helix transcriptional regulator [Thermoplasmatota archaeon]